MTPSGWHDDARSRDAGHDEMQAAHWRALHKLGPDWSITRQIEGEPRRLIVAGIYFEFPFVENKRLIGFADIGVTFEVHCGGRIHSWRIFSEIKPKIYSVGALVRQIQSTGIVAERAGFNNFDLGAVVYEDDPKTRLLEEVGRDLFTVVGIKRPEAVP